MARQRTRIIKTILKKKNEVGGISLPNFKPYYITTEIKIIDNDRGKTAQCIKRKK